MKLFKSLLSLYLVFGLTVPTQVLADAAIFSGSDVKILKDNLSLNGKAKLKTGTVDPSSVATDSPSGSLYLNTSTGKTYRKLDAGSTTNWKELVYKSDSDFNLISNPDAEASGTAGWTTGPSTTASDETTLPLLGKKSFKLINSSLTCSVFLTCDVSFRSAAIAAAPEAFKGQNLELSFFYKSAGSPYIVFKKAGVLVRNVSLPSNVSRQQISIGFIEGEADLVEFHDYGETLTFDEVRAGPPKNIGTTETTSNWLTYTPVLTNMGNATAVGKYRVDKKTVFIDVLITIGSTPPSGALSVGIPTTVTVDASAIPGGSSFFKESAKAVNNSSGATDIGSTRYDPATNKIDFWGDDGATVWNATVPVTWSNAGPHSLQFSISLPIVGGTEQVVRLNQMVDIHKEYKWYPENTTCPLGTIAADGTNGTKNMNAAFASGPGTQTVSGVVHTAGALGSINNDQMQGHVHGPNASSFLVGGGSGSANLGTGGAFNVSGATTGPLSDGTNGTPRTGSTTRPLNVVGLWCKVIAAGSEITAKHSVVSPSDGVEAMTRARVAGAATDQTNCTTSPCTIHRQSGSWLTSVTRSSTGFYVATWAPFGGIPSCNPNNTANGTFASVCTAIGISATGASISCIRADSGAPIDSFFDIMCQGPK